MSDGVEIDKGPATLAGLEARLARELALLCLPEPNWVPPRHAPDGSPVSDVVIIGAGMCGLTAEFALRSIGVRNVRIVDRAPEGREGPWVTFARMRTLRSPKHLTGPAQGLPNLTFRAWYEAQHGAAAWEGLGKIPRTMWMDYLRWYRRVLAVPVENGVTVERVEPVEELFRLPLAGPAGSSVAWARKVVLATGRDGLGGLHVPDFARGLPAGRVAHTADDIDFAALAGRRVAVIGAGASAMDNAAEALEAGCASLDMFVRRPFLPPVNKTIGAGHSGFVHAHPHLDDAWRWRLMRFPLAEQIPPPRTSVQRVARHANATLRLSTPVLAVAAEGDGVRIETPGGRHAFDFLILATGFAVDAWRQPEIADFAGEILLWGDRYRPPPDEAMEALLEYPYLGDAFELREREPGRAPFLSGIHCFNIAAALSLGKVSGDVPGISIGARWLAEGIARRLFEEDAALHWEALQRYDVAELQGDEWPEETILRGEAAAPRRARQRARVR